MKWYRRCSLCGEPIYHSGKNLGKSKYGKKRAYWAHPECIDNMKNFVEELKKNETNKV